MKLKKFPKVSIVMPTLNSQRTIEASLLSIRDQEYPGAVELIISDGGSVDQTINIAKKYKAKIIKNDLKTAEAGKAVGTKNSTGEIVAFIDSDNILPDKDWLKKLIIPLIKSDDIIAAEPLYFTYRKTDHYLTRYFAMLGMGDPLNLFIGNYDRYSFISDKWTQMNVKYEEKKGYLTLFLSKEIPTIGANGFVIKKKYLQKYPTGDYLFDIDVLNFLAKENPIKVVKVKIGIVHLFSGNIATFIRKQRRRIRDYIYFKKTGIRYSQISSLRVTFGVVKFIIFTVTIIPLIVQTFTGYFRKNDLAWFFHPIACWITLLVYGFEYVRSLFKITPFDRSKWSQ